MTQIKWFHAFLVFFLLRVVYLYEAHTTKKTKKNKKSSRPKKKEERRERKIGKPSKKNSPRVSITQARARDLNKKRDRYTNTQ
jgi:hypothetical protein